MNGGMHVYAQLNANKKSINLAVMLSVSPDIQLHPATYQCTGMYLHSGALLQRQRNELLSVPSASYQKVHS